jgi:phage tail sheath protein FI
VSGAPVAARAEQATLTTPGVYIQELPTTQTVAAASIATAAFVGTTATTSGPNPGLVLGPDGYAASFGAPSAASFLSLAVQQYFVEGGADAYVVSVGPADAPPTAAALIGDPAAKTGLYALDGLAPASYGTIVLPDLARLGVADAQQVIAAAASFAAERRVFLVADAPAAIQTPAAIASFQEALVASLTSAALANVALYFPPLSFLAPDGVTTVVAGAGGIVAGRYAATDASAGPWTSPAGVTHGAIRSPVTPTYTVTDADQDGLNPLGINAIRVLQQYGLVIWGARTLATDDAYSYVATRRTMLMIEQSLTQSLQWVVFEPNTPQLWSAITRAVSAFLTTIWEEGGLFGDTAAQAFFVTCDASNNPPETRELGYVYVAVGLALVNPAEFVVLNLQMTTEGPDSGG